ncbi:FAD-dependent oxidoreductase [Desulfatitalea tepidiphila]|uniref:FAD-dependent oxidoreductase n=1 Tax=Desulfatitalea tepidiphila TaxID=1185843 RepID=UPI0027386EB1|nr:FAD-dependent oxidoreductase [Desulfatitalea tepidiphila]
MVRTADVFRKKSGIDVRTEHQVEHIDLSEGLVSGQTREGKRFELPFDRLLIATGADPIVPARPGFDLPGVMVVKTLDDAQAIKERITSHPVKRAVILGMGYIAMEMAEALRERGIEVAMAKPRARLLPWLPEELAQRVGEELAAHQVARHTDFSVDHIEERGNHLAAVSASGDRLEADLVVVAIGVTPNSRLARDAGLALGPSDAIAVDRQMRTSDDRIYAAGDCADAFHVVTGGRVWIPLALRANRAGWAVADHLCGREVSLQGVVGSAVFKVFDLEVARTGLTAAEAAEAGFDPATVTIKASSKAHAMPGASPILVHMVGDRRSGRLLGAQMVGREGAAHRINTAAVALHAAMTVAQFCESDLAYAPPFGPTWDPLLVAANQLIKAMK